MTPDPRVGARETWIAEESRLPRGEILWFLGALAAIAAVHWFRDPASYLLPPLSYEDGRDYFAFYYNHREPGAVFRFYAGYVSLVPNLAAYLALGLPVRWAPRALAWIPWILVTLACALPYLTLRPWMRSRIWRLGLCLTLALLPVANRLFISSTAYSIWALLLLLVWASLARLPASWRGALLRLGPMAALIASHPLSIALIPIYGLQAWKGWRGRRMPVYPLALAAIAALYALLGVERGNTDLPGPIVAAGRTGVFLLERVVFATLFGDTTVGSLRGAAATVWIYLTAIAVLAAIAILIVRWRHRLGVEGLWLLAALGWLILAFTGLYVLSRSPGLHILDDGAAFRYFWVQRLLFAAGLAILAQAGLAGRRTDEFPQVVRSALVWLLFAALAVLNFRNQDAYRCPRRQGHQMAAFVTEVARQEATGRVEATLPRRGPWSVVLKSPAASPKP